jgi:hypothetical protein
VRGLRKQFFFEYGVRGLRKQLLSGVAKGKEQQEAFIADLWNEDSERALLGISRLRKICCSGLPQDLYAYPPIQPT